MRKQNQIRDLTAKNYRSLSGTLRDHYQADALTGGYLKGAGASLSYRDRPSQRADKTVPGTTQVSTNCCAVNIGF